MQTVAIIGAGVSGLSVAQLLKNKYDVTVYEKDNTPGGLIKCKRLDGSLFHTCGGHVFNSKRKDVLEWFWNNFSQPKEFSNANRNSVVYMENGIKIPYPIENHMYMFDKEIQNSFINDLLDVVRHGYNTPHNFEEFLKGRFGETLYKLYFKPYNEKVWRRDLQNVPLSWLEGKLPMPTVEEMFFNNMNHIEEHQFVHSSFWYEKINGSQFIADKLSSNLKVNYNINVSSLRFEKKHWYINDKCFDNVVFCGNIKDMVNIIFGINIEKYKESIAKLEYHGTTSVFCEIDANPYSWIYQPSRHHESHRIICTGNFAESNNGANIPKGRITGTVEFTDEFTKEQIMDNLSLMPFNPKYIEHKYNKYTYPIQNANTRNIIKSLKTELSSYNFYFSGRFADWEYYNMDTAMGAAMDLCKTL